MVSVSISFAGNSILYIEFCDESLWINTNEQEINEKSIDDVKEAHPPWVVRKKKKPLFYRNLLQMCRYPYTIFFVLHRYPELMALRPIWMNLVYRKPFV